MISLTITETITRQYVLEDIPENWAIIEKLREDMLGAGKPQLQILGLTPAPKVSLPPVLEGQEKASLKEVTEYSLTTRRRYNGAAFREHGTHGHVNRDTL
ncbi:hypothetical protein CcrBL47_gp364 [Caulobacter phage BL47]|nr:hypothetical protein CcrBL47_gp364 [Caulobacter phage BL47]